MLEGALAKFLKIKGMPMDELVSMLGKKAKNYGGSAVNMVKAKPAESAGIAALGGGVGAAMSGESDEDEALEDMDDDELKRMYGLR